jgi:hypothetical protein
MLDHKTEVAIGGSKDVAFARVFRRRGRRSGRGPLPPEAPRPGSELSATRNWSGGHALRQDHGQTKRKKTRVRSVEGVRTIVIATGSIGRGVA